MRLLKYPTSLIMGKNNYIEQGVTISKNVIIGSNNKIYSGTIIYPNTTIGNGNVILNDNVLGEHAVNASETFTGKKFGGLSIGNNNFMHVRNLIFSGEYKQTKLGDDNKILAECHIGHDVCIQNNVVLYPKATIGGLCTLMNYSTVGINASIQQKTVIGSFSMIGMGSIASHSVFPFYIYFNQQYTRPNVAKIPTHLHITEYDRILKELIAKLRKTECSRECVASFNMPPSITNYIYPFIDQLSIKKI